MIPGTAAISSDIDTLASIYKGRGCKRASGYSYAELRIGLENFSRFLERYAAKATLFMVGSDFLVDTNHAAIRGVAAEGHEIANHSMNHVQGFRMLSVAEKEAEIAGMEDACKNTIGVTPVGFRSPGWNIADDVLPILRRRGYRYDSSVFPTSLAPVLKIAHRRAMASGTRAERTTMGQSSYAFAPTQPYMTSADRLGIAGHGGIVEIPITVTPIVRLPFFATFLLATGFPLFKRSYKRLRRAGRAIHFQFHLSDFVDYAHPELADQVPAAGDGVYVPQALRTSLSAKLDLFQRAIDVIAADYTFVPLVRWADAIAGDR